MESSQSSKRDRERCAPQKGKRNPKRIPMRMRNARNSIPNVFYAKGCKKKSYPRTRAGKNCNCTACNGQKDKAAEQEAEEEEQEELPPGTFTYHMNNATSCRILL